MKIANIPKRLLDPEDLASLFCQHNPDVIKLCVAENVLLLDRVKQYLAEGPPYTERELRYAVAFGDEESRGLIAALLNRTFGLSHCPIEAEQVTGFGGTRVAIRTVAALLCQTYNPDTFLVPTPFWQGFISIFEKRLGARIQPVRQNTGYKMTLADVQRAYEQTLDRLGVTPRAIVVTNPQNPLGLNYDRKELERIYRWVAEQTTMHVISDEIYGHSQTAGGRARFVSALALDVSQEHPDRVHVTWGFGKDFGASGLRCGVLVSRSEHLHGMAREFSYYSPFNTATAHVVKTLLSARGGGIDLERGVASGDVDRGVELMGLYEQRLTRQWSETKAMLHEQGVAVYPDSDAAQFLWLDLRPYLGRLARSHEEYARKLSGSSQFEWFDPNDDFEPAQDLDYLNFEEFQGHPDNDEKRLNDFISEVAKVSLLPGTVLSHDTQGFFRMCYTSQTLPVLNQAIGRLANALEVLRNENR